VSRSLDIERKRGHYRNGLPADAKLAFCIQQLESAEGFADDLGWGDEIVPGLTIEELVGTLLHAHDELEGAEA
jgi:hypothetical protein